MSVRLVDRLVAIEHVLCRLPKRFLHLQFALLLRDFESGAVEIEHGLELADHVVLRSEEVRLEATAGEVCAARVNGEWTSLRSDDSGEDVDAGRVTILEGGESELAHSMPDPVVMRRIAVFVMVTDDGKTEPSDTSPPFVLVRLACDGRDGVTLRARSRRSSR
jgi:hypothetical protein